MTVAIRATGVSKKYAIGPRVPYRRLTEALAGVLDLPRRALRRGGASPRAHGDFWALRDVCFDVAHGEVVGILGRNGAGKSTLLKILSRITEMTAGEVQLRGRVGSLLEVGTGFHPELTGRENVFLNGAILGMRRAEVARNFDAIVAFAEVDKFIDTAVKHYSSGMYTRLAFAVAAHLDPEILLVDEVLAVGDLAFQKRCIERMSEIGAEGRTVITVSHNMEVLATLARRAIWLDQGTVRADGESKEVIRAYKASLQQRGDAGARVQRSGKHLIEWLEVVGDDGNPTTVFDHGEHINLVVATTRELPPATYFEWVLFTDRGFQATSGGTFMSPTPVSVPTATGVLRARIGPVTLAAGTYSLALRLGVEPGYVLDEWRDAADITVPVHRDERTAIPFDARRGVVFVPAVYQEAPKPAGRGSQEVSDGRR